MHHHSTAGANLGALLNLIGDAWVTFCEFSGGADSAEMTEAGIRGMAEDVSSVWDDERVDLPALVMLVEDRWSEFVRYCDSTEDADRTLESLKTAAGMI